MKSPFICFKKNQRDWGHRPLRDKEAVIVSYQKETKSTWEQTPSLSRGSGSMKSMALPSSQSINCRPGYAWPVDYHTTNQQLKNFLCFSYEKHKRTCVPECRSLKARSRTTQYAQTGLPTIMMIYLPLRRFWDCATENIVPQTRSTVDTKFRPQEL